MAFVGQTMDPWDVPVKQAVEVMQKIWGATSDHEYEIMTSTPVYQKVCDRFGSRTVLIYIFQTVQRCADSWRNGVGSTGITSLLSFFDSQEYLLDSDEERQEFAKYYLEDLHFLYKDSDREDKKVRKSGCYPVHVSDNEMILYRNGRGFFAAPWLSRRLLHTSLLPKVLKRFLASTILINQLLQLSVV